MKATSKMYKGGTDDQLRATCDTFDYLFLEVKDNPSCPDRVAWIGGNLDGYGVISRKASLMAVAMDYGHEHLRGRRIRHMVLSCEECEEADRADAECRLRDSAPLLAALHGARRWIAVIHRDTPKPHMHLILANFDEEKCRRFDFRPDFLSEVQKMQWTPHFETGKGHHSGMRGPRGQVIEQLRLLRKKECPIKRARALKKLQNFLARMKAYGRNKDAIVAALTSQNLPPGWDGTKLLTKSGKPRAKPSLIISDVEIRIEFYLRCTRGRPFWDLDRRDPEPDVPGL